MEEKKEKKGVTRRTFFKWLGGGSFLVAFIGTAYFYLRSLLPNVLYEPLKRLKIGHPDNFPEGHKFLPDLRVFIFKEGDEMYSISSVCTHLGCNVKVIALPEPRKVKVGKEEFEETFEFVCPCHGSHFHADGTPYAGPAPTPLERYALEISPEDGQVIIDKNKTVAKTFRLKLKQATLRLLRRKKMEA